MSLPAVLDEASAAYAAKLRRNGRPEYLVLAFLALSLAMRQALTQDAATKAAYTQRVNAAILILAYALARYSAEQLGTPSSHSASIARQLQYAISLAILKNSYALTPDQLWARVALILQAETQRMTALIVLAAAAHPAHSASITRSAAPGACPRCEALAGTYTPPYPADLYWTHPHCACSWSSP